MTWKLAQFAVGRPLGAADAASVRSIHQAAWKAGGSWSDLVTALVTSDLVMMTRTQSDTQTTTGQGTEKQPAP